MIVTLERREGLLLLVPSTFRESIGIVGYCQPALPAKQPGRIVLYLNKKFL
jgi:hypothetical protein